MEEESTEQELIRLAKNLALARLNRREYSAQEIRQYLISKGASDRVASRVVAELEEQGTICDSRYSRIITRHQGSRGKGPAYIKQKLKQKGITMDIKDIQSVSEEISEKTEFEMAFEIVERRYPQAWVDKASANKAFQALIRRGFSYSVAAQVLKKPI